MFIRLIAILCFVLISDACSLAQEALEYVPAAVDNPLKGLVPYSGDKRDNFPHSMEFNYLPLSSLMTGMTEFNWQPLEKLLDDVAGRGHQTVFRVWMVYPGHDDGIPEFLVKDGLKVTTWLNSATEPFPPAKVHTPDYNDPRMRTALNNFIAALGEKYDGDPRIGFLTAGLLGTWGEWHEYPRQDLFASKETQAEVLEAFTAAFHVTPVLLRYPTGDDHWLYTKNADRPFGYHDDSFAWATLDTGRDEDSWFFMPSMKVAGNAALEKWKMHPIGGEIRPELWGMIFDDKVEHKQAQDFDQSVRETHATWLMDTGMMEKKQSDTRVSNASRAVQKMGYEFYVTRASVARDADRAHMKLQLQNTGVAPFYYDWRIVVAALDRNGKPLKKWPTDWKITGLLPDNSSRSWELSVESSQIPSDTEWLAVRIVNPLPLGLPLRFANTAERQQADGWFRIGRIRSAAGVRSR
ncbi:MAG: DUF4832 domain-containing protein [Planctomycetota bacterium]|nr:DUF4832 domain-containing protein [Planctomycetota bacterium]